MTCVEQNTVQRQAETSRDDSTKCVLVVEDDDDVGPLLAEALEAGGFRAQVVGDGLRAIEYLRNGNGKCPDLILLDMMMPVMDGWGFRREQEKMPEVANIPVVVLTADGDAREKASSVRAQGYLGKPVSVEDLLNEVERLCGRPADF
jgi:CheY-like chemotaxis protein